MGYTLLPRGEAIAAAGNFAAHVEAATSYFFESHRFESLTEEGRTDLVPVAPSVILLDDSAPLQRVATAMDGLFFATMVFNTSDRYANSANFIQFTHSVGSGSPGEMGRRFRTLFGSKVLGTRARHSIETRPTWCGEYRQHHEDTLHLFESIADSGAAEPILQALRPLHAAMSDSDNLDRDLEHAFYALALERLLHRSNQSRNTRAAQQASLAHDLLASALDGVSRLRESTSATGDFAYRSGILEAVRWVRDDRNAAWHADPTGQRTPLHNQLVIRPNIVAFRAVSALVLASMAQQSPTHTTRGVIGYIAACEHWIEEIRSLTQTTPQSALNRFGYLWARYTEGAG